MNIILLYSADSATSRESFALMAVCDDKETAVKIAAEAAGYTDEPLTEADRAALLEEYETRGRGENFAIVGAELNELI